MASSSGLAGNMAMPVLSLHMVDFVHASNGEKVNFGRNYTFNMGIGSQISNVTNSAKPTSFGGFSQDQLDSLATILQKENGRAPNENEKKAYDAIVRNGNKKAGKEGQALADGKFVTCKIDVTMMTGLADMKPLKKASISSSEESVTGKPSLMRGFIASLFRSNVKSKSAQASTSVPDSDTVLESRKKSRFSSLVSAVKGIFTRKPPVRIEKSDYYDKPQKGSQEENENIAKLSSRNSVSLIDCDSDSEWDDDDGVANGKTVHGKHQESQAVLPPQRQERAIDVPDFMPIAVNNESPIYENIAVVTSPFLRNSNIRSTIHAHHRESQAVLLPQRPERAIDVRPSVSVVVKPGLETSKQAETLLQAEILKKRGELKKPKISEKPQDLVLKRADIVSLPSQSSPVTSDGDKSPSVKDAFRFWKNINDQAESTVTPRPVNRPLRSIPSISTSEVDSSSSAGDKQGMAAVNNEFLHRLQGFREHH